jgi:hypothetical protein
VLFVQGDFPFGDALFEEILELIRVETVWLANVTVPRIGNWFHIGPEDMGECFDELFVLFLRTRHGFLLY